MVLFYVTFIDLNSGEIAMQETVGMFTHNGSCYNPGIIKDTAGKAVDNLSGNILCGNVLDILKTLPDKCIDMTFTSPPYFNQRFYKSTPIVWDGDEICEHDWGEIKNKALQLQTGNKEFQRKWREEASSKEANLGCFCNKCGAWKGQLGQEPTPDLYIKHLCSIYKEIKRVLKDDGTCWINLGDTYRDKSLLQIPHLFATEMIDNGYIMRNVIVWSKDNAMPSNCTDRFTVDFEYLFFFTKNRNYYFEQQFEPVLYYENRASGLVRHRRPRRFQPSHGKKYRDKINGNEYELYDDKNNFKGPSGLYRADGTRKNDPEKRNKRCVWNINTKGFTGSHFATMPLELIETPIKAGCPESVCKKCGKARVKVIDSESVPTRPGNMSKDTDGVFAASRKRFMPVYKGDYYETCDCNAGFDPGIVLDPFVGSGTTCIMTERLNRRWIGVDISVEYCKMAIERIKTGK